MLMSAEFPSKYLRAADLQGREIKVIMQHVEREEIGQDTDLKHKPVVYFKGKEKGLVLNKTNADVISHHYGDDTDDWYDQPLILFAAMVSFKGKSQPAIRCRIPTAKDNRPAPQRNRRLEDIEQEPPQRTTFGSSAKLGADDPITSGPQRPISDFPGDRPMEDDIEF